MSKRPKTSYIWNYFCVKDPVNKTAQCNMCNHILNYKTTISNLKKHIERRHATVNLEESNGGKRKQSEFNYFSEPSCSTANASLLLESSSHENDKAGESTHSCQNIKSQPMPESNQCKILPFMPAPNELSEPNKKKLDKLLLQLFIRDYQPFSIVNDEGFINFVKGLNPSYHLPDKKTITTSMIPAEYERCFNKLGKNVLSLSSVCITTDCWTSTDMESFLAVTAHYVTNNFELRSVLLGCSLLPESHTSDNLANVIWGILDRFHLIEKVLVIVSDNTANIKGAVDGLQMEHFGCFAHTINLTCQDALALPEIKTLVAKVKSIVSYFKKSAIDQEKLNSAQRSMDLVPKKLLQEVSTRWNSTFYMLKRVVELKDPIKTTIGLINKDLPILSENEWQTCKDLTVILEPLEEVTRKISSEKYVSGSLVIPLTNGLKSVNDKMAEENFSPEAKKVILRLKDGLNETLVNIEKNKSLGLATFLDPRFKSAPFASESEAKSIKDYCQSLMAQVWSEKNMKAIKGGEEERNDTIMPIVEVKVEFGVKAEVKKYSVWENLELKIASNMNSGSKTSAAIIELNRYMEEGYLDRENYPLQWWNKNKIYYPLMATVARDKLCMVASSVPCDRLFSKAGNLITERRSRLKANNVEKLLFLNAKY